MTVTVHLFRLIGRMQQTTKKDDVQDSSRDAKESSGTRLSNIGLLFIIYICHIHISFRSLKH